MDEVESQLIDILHGLALAQDGSERSAAWHDLNDASPGHKDLAAAFDKAAEADDPIEVARADSNVGTRLNGALQNRWLSRWRREKRNLEPTLRSITWEWLDEGERSEVREMLRDLARFERRFVRRGRIQKAALDDALLSIAEEYLRWTGDYHRHVRQLAHAPESRFIKFATLALQPAGLHFEVSPEALGRRWSRIVKDERAQMKDFESDDDPDSGATGD
jgi:hypothetical protein